MKVFSIYLFCIALLTYHGLSMANNIKKDLLNQSNSINSAVTSYSQYLQTLNWFIMKYLQQIIFYLFTRLNHTLKNCDRFFYNLQDETEQFLDDLDSYYLKGLLNYSYDGCISEDDAEQLLEEHGLFLDQYIQQTKDTNFVIINLVEFLGYWLLCLLLILY